MVKKIGISVKTYFGSHKIMVLSIAWLKIDQPAYLGGNRFFDHKVEPPMTRRFGVVAQFVMSKLQKSILWHGQERLERGAI